MRVLVGLALAVLLVSAAWSVVASAVHDEPRSSALPVPTVTTAVTTTTRAPSGAGTSSAAVGSSTIAPTSVASTTTSAPRFTTAEIATHASSTSCWLLVGSRVYDVTAYLRSHPGGSRTITPWCGKESTVAFATEDGRGEHSTDAYAQLDRYLIGELAP